MTRAPRPTREDDSRTEEWTPANLLPDPEPMDGFAFKWVRKSILGETDVMNMSRRRREGWEPVTSEDQPTLAPFSETNGIVEIGGLILCKMPQERANARKRYYSRLAEEQVTGLSRQLSNEASPDHRMPLIEERSTKVSKSPGA